MRTRFFAILMLLMTTMWWGLAYPVNKALLELQHPLAGATNDLVLTGLTLGSLFGLAAVCLLMVIVFRPGRFTARELQQGIGVGIFTAAGLWLLFLGLRYTNGSTVAFLNQFYSAEIVIFVALQSRRWPSLQTTCALVAMIAGCWVLSGFDPKAFTLGKGELFGLLCSFGFAAQVLWNGRAVYSENDALRSTTIMAATVAVINLAITIPLASSPQVLADIYSTPATLGVGAFTTITWIVAGYWLLIAFQRFVPATQAAVILAFEPVFAAAFALFIPGWIAQLTGSAHQNETLTQSLLIGGGLILLANVVLQFNTEPPAPSESTDSTSSSPIAP